MIRGGRLSSVRSRRWDLQRPKSMEVFSAILGRGVDRRWGFGAAVVRSKVRRRWTGFPYHRATSCLDKVQW